MDELQAGIELSFTVLPQTPTFLQPCKGLLHHPALRYHREGVQLIALDRLSKRLPCVAAIDQHAFDLTQVGGTPIYRL